MKCPIQNKCKKADIDYDVCHECIHSVTHGSKHSFVNHFEPANGTVIYNQEALDEFADGLDG